MFEHKWGTFMMGATEDLLNNIQTFQPLKMAVITPPGQPVCCKVSDVVPVQHYHHTASCIIHPVKGRDNWTHAADPGSAPGLFLLGSFQDTFGGDIALYKQKWMDSSGIWIPTPTGDTRWGSSRAAGSLPGGIVGPLCTSPLKTGHCSAEILPPTATTSTNTRTYCCLIIGMFTQLADATATKGTQRATRGGAFCRRRKKRV